MSPIFITYVPGTMLDVPADQFNDANSLFSLMLQSLDDASIALDCYQTARQLARARAEREMSKNLTEAREKAFNLGEFEKEVSARCDFRDPTSNAFWTKQELREYRLNVALAVAQERARLGHIPLAHTSRAPFVHALSFLSAADRFRRALSRLHHMRPELKPMVEQLRSSLPGLKNVRDSSQHIDERSQGIGERRKALPVSTILIESLVGDELTCTSGTGEIVSLSITQDTAVELTKIHQGAVALLPWKGPAEVHPRFSQILE